MSLNIIHWLVLEVKSKFVSKHINGHHHGSQGSSCFHAFKMISGNIQVICITWSVSDLYLQPLPNRNPRATGQDLNPIKTFKSPDVFFLPNLVSIVHLGFGSSTHDLSVDVHLGKMILWLAFWDLVSTAQLYQTIILSYIFLAGCNFEGFSAFSTWTWKGKIYFRRAKFSVK